ncbi:MAG: CaiB/BaiF CoA-transferase family protein [Phenylobacterium sp.]|uniref:CaiB/BaiF CoA transferase family protein n=1 Tax=Phenylobacterium sp. TaxID=1871053 RepID=UPI0027358CE6|nr:CaiB/BaiF CoA-transferase family protein [Phenylobacterium sp.]MDP3750007.1 CaiB/BaiF CoA-transferase family protein [Phenylobacterium sp.]
MRSGPLAGLRIVEFVGIGPGPFCGMLLADLGADIVRIDRPRSSERQESRFNVTARGRRTVICDLKSPEGVETALQLIEQAEALIEGFRPGVMERLGLSPDVVLARQPSLVYGRMTGWGQEGPYAQAAGHDGNYISLSGALAAIGTAERPILPLNLVGDYGGGGMFLAMGLLAGLTHARATGRGQVVDCAMSDCAASLMAPIYGMFAGGQHINARASNRLDGGAPFYNVYQCADGKWVTICSLEQAFYELLLQKLGLSDADYGYPLERAKWSDLHARLTEIMASRTRAEWCDLLEATDVCFAPVLDLTEAPAHAHNQARQTFVEVDGVVQPAPSPRFSETPGAISAPPTNEPQAAEVFRDWNVRSGV